MDTVGSDLSADSTGRNTTSVEGILTLRALRGREAGLRQGLPRHLGSLRLQCGTVGNVEWEADGVGVQRAAFRVKPGLEDWPCCLRLCDL